MRKNFINLKTLLLAPAIAGVATLGLYSCGDDETAADPSLYGPIVELDCSTDGPTVSMSTSATELNCSVSSIDVTLNLGADETALWSNGETGSFSTGSAGTYTVTVYNNDGDCEATSSVTLTSSSAVPTASIAADNDAIGCGIADIDLVASSSSATATYKWSDNSTASTLNVTAGGTYTVTVSEGGCTATSAIVIAGTPVFCTETLIDFDPANADAFLLYDGTTNKQWYSIGGTTSDVVTTSPAPYNGTHSWKCAINLAAGEYFGGGSGVKTGDVGVTGDFDFTANDSIIFWVNTQANSATQLRLRLIDSDGDMMLGTWDLPATNGWVRQAIKVGDTVKDAYQSPAAPAGADGVWTDPSAVDDISFAIHDGPGTGAAIEASIDNVLVKRKQ